jgi:hypothetical protein
VNPGIPASAYSGSGNTLYCFDGVSYNLRALNLAAIGTPAVDAHRPTSPSGHKRPSRGAARRVAAVRRGAWTGGNLPDPVH